MNKVYQIITNRIIESLKQNKVPWMRTWKNIGEPSNAVSGERYKGINALLLWEVSSNYGSPWFITQRQAEQLGGEVRQDQKKKGSMIVFWKVFNNSSEEEDASNETKDKGKKNFVLRYYMVYSINQCINLRLPERCKELEKNRSAKISLPESVFRNYIQRSGIGEEYGRPSYSPSKDILRLPSFDDFNSPEAFYATAFHEAIHSTGHISRLARFKEGEAVCFGSEVYSKEELVAELGAAFLCAKTNIERESTYQNSVSYIQSWISVLEDDPRMIIMAASKAQKATDYILEI